MDERGKVLDLLLQEHRDTEAVTSFFVRLLEYDVPEVIHSDKLWSYGVALRELPVLHDVEHIQVVSTTRCNTLVEQSQRRVRQQPRSTQSCLWTRPQRGEERSQLGFTRRRRRQKVLALHAPVPNLHRHTRTTVPAALKRSNQIAALLLWQEAMQQAA